MNTVVQPSLLQIQQKLHHLLPQLREKYQINTLGIFGSFARNQNTEKSDLDLMVSFKKLPSLLRFVELKFELSDLLEVPVDLVIQEDLKPNVMNSALQDAIFI